ncbi:two-component system, chemotaxis family, response regulator CheB [Catalinimonas alkaloidigena]|uniref:protein-glutamate methylesterase n=1 Tax=Catalinimonas alkaloidigena TaxID=1075417 RepID=A0A1G9T6U8_9BACT|nr:chemotaxis protein CheB [Catalinimonas alkaloidigena]SDM43453.1 two-component system, chemotaxis family, response regulator CheB [Catalinimonas alkaloidigena]
MVEVPKLIVIGGSWGGIQASLSILEELPAAYPIPIVLVLHRLRNAESDLQYLFQKKLTLRVKEVDEKESIEAGMVYLAPANYHVLIERDRTFALDVSELENYSRPSIDVTFTSAAETFGAEATGILLSGASRDGSAGLKDIWTQGGMALVQNPDEAEVKTMPMAAISLIPDCLVQNVAQIHSFLLSFA